MKKSVKLISVLLTVFMLLSMIPLSALAYGSEDGKLIITHINTSSPEGAGVILTPTLGETVSSTYTYWVLVTFDWNTAENCFKVTKVQSATGDKSSTAIPENGFVYAVNTGNNYPELYANTTDPAKKALYKDKPNYTSEKTTNSYKYAKSLAVGSKAYLYSADVKNDIIDVTGTTWYTDSFVTNSYIKIGTPDSTGTPYDPNNTEIKLVQQTINVNNINKFGGSTDMSIIFTRSYGTDIYGTNDSQKYLWWKTAVFDWNDTDKCYILSSIDIRNDGATAKQPIIPENGFALAIIEGSTTNTSLANMDKIKVGAKAYVHGADLKAGTITSSAKICVNLPDTALTEYKPVISDRLAAPALTNMTEKRTVTKDDGFTIQWSAVTGATSYVVNVSDSTDVTDGSLIIRNQSVTGTSCTIGDGILTAGKNYTVTVYAVGTDKAASMLSRAKLGVISDEAFTSNLRTKTIVAFGDSLTARTGWVNLLGVRFGSDIINSGVGGDNSTAGRVRFESQVLAYKPDIVIINFGMNDQAVGTGAGTPITPLDTYISNLDYFAKTLIEAGTDVIFVTPNKVCTASGYYVPGGYNLNYGSDSMLKYCDAMRKVACKYGCGLVDINNECNFEDLTKFCNAGDGIHQSTYGHQRYAELIGGYLAAVYDNKDLSSLEVKFQDAFGNSLAQSVTLKGAVGANVIVSGIDMKGYTLAAAPSNYKFTSTPGTVTLTYVQNSIEIDETSGFTVKDNCVYINKENMTSADILSKVKTSGVTCVLKSGSLVGTGSKLQILSGTTVTSELTVILPGDVSGDGVLDSADYLMLKKHAIGNLKLENEFFTAGDIDKGGEIDSVDCLKLKKHIIGTGILF